MTNADRRAQLARMRSERRCTWQSCRAPLPAGYRYRRCDGCRKKAAEIYRRAHGCVSRDESRAASTKRLELIAQTARTHTAQQQAALLGVSMARIGHLRAQARLRGFDVPKEIGGRVRVNESPRWRELDKKTARCRCGLLLPCERCLHGDAADRSGPGRVYPGGAW